MVDIIKSFFDRVTLLWGAAIVLVGWIVYIVSWKSDMESRINTLETRGSPHLEKIDNRLTVLESQTHTNRASIERIAEIMLRELNSKGQKP